MGSPHMSVQCKLPQPLLLRERLFVAAASVAAELSLLHKLSTTDS
jgi:hypothetical protein